MSKREDPFARVPKTTLNDERLSWRAKGLLSYLIGKPLYWKVRVSDLINRSTDGQTAIRSALKELEEIGYAKLEDVRGQKGTVVEWVWKISDSPIFSPESGKPDLDKPDLENHEHSKNDCSKNDLRSKESKGTLPTECSPILSQRHKWDQLKQIRAPRDYPSQDEFNDFCDEIGLDKVPNYRPDLYLELCHNKWHQWNTDSNRWIPIADWQAFVAGLDAVINPNY